jgi:hypothetical protein
MSSIVWMSLVGVILQRPICGTPFLMSLVEASTDTPKSDRDRRPCP